MECFVASDLKFNTVLCSGIMTAASENNDFFYFLYKGANLSEIDTKMFMHKGMTKM
jgi:hypothetical protein